MDIFFIKSKGDGYYCVIMINNLFFIDKVMKRISKFFLKEKKVESFFFIFKIWVVISIYFFWINENILIGMYNK